MSRTWTIDEASADLPSLLEAARTSSQYIIVPDGRFRVSFDNQVLSDHKQTNSLEEILNQDGRLRPSDIQDV